jgi:hypothetical protein
MAGGGARRLTYAQLERVARMYKTDTAAAHAMGLSLGGVFARACRREGIESPSQRTKREKKESKYGVD